MHVDVETSLFTVIVVGTAVSDGHTVFVPEYLLYTFYLRCNSEQLRRVSIFVLLRLVQIKLWYVWHTQRSHQILLIKYDLGSIVQIDLHIQLTHLLDPVTLLRFCLQCLILLSKFSICCHFLYQLTGLFVYRYRTGHGELKKSKNDIFQ